MRKVKITILLSCIVIAGCAKKHVGIGMDVYSSYNTTAENWYELDIKVIVDESKISDQDTCAKEIIQHILNNDFHNIRFSFDKNGYPNEITVDVFTSEKNLLESRKSFSFEYVTEFQTENTGIQNNIKDNPDEFQIRFNDS